MTSMPSSDNDVPKIFDHDKPKSKSNTLSSSLTSMQSFLNKKVPDQAQSTLSTILSSMPSSFHDDVPMTVKIFDTNKPKSTLSSMTSMPSSDDKPKSITTMSSMTSMPSYNNDVKQSMIDRQLSFLKWMEVGRLAMVKTNSCHLKEALEKYKEKTAVQAQWKIFDAS
eukprot:12055971-Karenia_brevis.AAC.1